MAVVNEGDSLDDFRFLFLLISSIFVDIDGDDGDQLDDEDSGNDDGDDDYYDDDNDDDGDDDDVHADDGDDYDYDYGDDDDDDDSRGLLFGKVFVNRRWCFSAVFCWQGLVFWYVQLATKTHLVKMKPPQGINGENQAHAEDLFC